MPTAKIDYTNLIKHLKAVLAGQCSCKLVSNNDDIATDKICICLPGLESYYTKQTFYITTALEEVESVILFKEREVDKSEFVSGQRQEVSRLTWDIINGVRQGKELERVKKINSIIAKL